MRVGKFLGQVLLINVELLLELELEIWWQRVIPGGVEQVELELSREEKRRLGVMVLRVNIGESVGR